MSVRERERERGREKYTITIPSSLPPSLVYFKQTIVGV